MSIGNGIPDEDEIWDTNTSIRVRQLATWIESRSCLEVGLTEEDISILEFPVSASGPGASVWNSCVPRVNAASKRLDIHILVVWAGFMNIRACYALAIWYIAVSVSTRGTSNSIRAILAMTDFEVIFDDTHPRADPFFENKRSNVDHIVVPACGNTP